jgi:hypothetical protein
MYVGKGAALTRVLEHTSDGRLENEGELLDRKALMAFEKRRGGDRKKKKERLRADVPYWITFFECENRIAKYIEQLFLDVYQFPVNKNENPGKGELWASWVEDRYELGTEIHAVSNLPNAPRGF